MKNIVLCADDYGQTIEISQAIIDLIKHKRLSATSCIVNTPHWAAHANWLKPYQDEIDVGLHLNLTEGQPLSIEFRKIYGQTFLSLPFLLSYSLLRKLDITAIEKECHAQLDQFMAKMGTFPHFIDGHQHVHQFPVIREALIRVYLSRLSSEKSYLRLVNEKWHWSDLFAGGKKFVITSQTPFFRKQLRKHHISHNSTFAGIYGFSGHYRHHFRRFLLSVKAGGLIMCHPGRQSSGKDPMAQARFKEFLYFSDQAFLLDCKMQGVFIKRFFD